MARALGTPLRPQLWVTRHSATPLAITSRGAASDSNSERRGRRRPRETDLGKAPDAARSRDSGASADSGPVSPRTGASAASAAASGSPRAGSDQQGRRPARGEPKENTRNVERDVDAHMKRIQDRSKQVFEDRPAESLESVKFRSDWRNAQGHKVPARFRLQDPPPRPPRRAETEDGEPPSAEEQREAKEARSQELKDYSKKPYADFAGLRFPTLETAESYNYHLDNGLDKLVERSFPIMVPGYRRLDPYLREYIHFLHRLDPARFTVARIAERYRLREKTVSKVVQEWSSNHWLTSSGLTSLRDKQATKESVIMQKKEEMYAKWVGWDTLGDEEDASDDDEELGEFRGWRATSDWVRRQKVEVEMMSAFPMMEKRSPMPKRVDVDMTVASSRSFKVINWIDPTDKVVF